MQIKLVVVEGAASKGEIELQLPAVIGRSRDANLTIGHPKVSRHHCELVEVDGRLKVRDNGSLNGTLLDGERITEAVVPPGARLTIGPLTFVAVYQPPPDEEAEAHVPVFSASDPTDGDNEMVPDFTLAAEAAESSDEDAELDRLAAAALQDADHDQAEPVDEDDASDDEKMTTPEAEIETDPAASEDERDDAEMQDAVDDVEPDSTATAAPEAVNEELEEAVQQPARAESVASEDVKTTPNGDEHDEKTSQLDEDTTDDVDDESLTAPADMRDKAASPTFDSGDSDESTDGDKTPSFDVSEEQESSPVSEQDEEDTDESSGDAALEAFLRDLG